MTSDPLVGILVGGAAFAIIVGIVWFLAWITGR